MFKEYEGFIDLDLILKEIYHYEYDPDNLSDFYNQDFVEMEANGVTAMCWIKYKENKYLFKPMEDASINWWGELLSCQLAKKLNIPCCQYRACKLGKEYGVITEMINKKDETLKLGSEFFQDFFNQYPKMKKELVSVLENKSFTDLYQIPEHFIQFSLYDQQRYLFNYLNNLEQVQSILSDFQNIKLVNPDKHYNFSNLNEQEITSIIEFQTIMLLFDIVSLQGDRNPNNWGIICSNQKFSPCPLFDNSTSFGLGYKNVKSRIYDFRNQVLTYRHLKNDLLIQNYLYQSKPLYTLSGENVIDPTHKIKDDTLKIFDSFMTKYDNKYKDLASYFIEQIKGENFSHIIDQAEKENGIMMSAEVRFYIESAMEFHSHYLYGIMNKHKVRSSSNGK